VRGESELFRKGELLERFKELGTMIGDILRSFKIPVSEVEDLLQPIFEQALVHQEEIRDPGPWLLETLRNLCRAYDGGQRQPGARRIGHERDARSRVPARRERVGPGRGFRNARRHRRRSPTKE
jgi:DNA-directed RNA polymerase specialized sigma24 family protein